MRQICKTVDCNSPSVIQYHLGRLEAKGFIRRQKWEILKFDYDKDEI